MKAEIVVHTMAHHGALVKSSIAMKQYEDTWYEEYKRIHDECFHDMRTALALTPVNCCDSREKLMEKQDSVFIYTEGNMLMGSVAIDGHEIDDLIVAKAYQRRGYGQLFLNFAVAHMQERLVSPIVLRVADWNKGAIRLYLRNGFNCVKTEIVNRG